MHLYVSILQNSILHGVCVCVFVCLFDAQGKARSDWAVSGSSSLSSRCVLAIVAVQQRNECSLICTLVAKITVSLLLRPKFQSNLSSARDHWRFISEGPTQTVMTMYNPKSLGVGLRSMRKLDLNLETEERLVAFPHAQAQGSGSKLLICFRICFVVFFVFACWFSNKSITTTGCLFVLLLPGNFSRWKNVVSCSL